MATQFPTLSSLKIDGLESGPLDAEIQESAIQLATLFHDALELKDIPNPKIQIEIEKESRIKIESYTADGLQGVVLIKKGQANWSGLCENLLALSSKVRRTVDEHLQNLAQKHQSNLELAQTSVRKIVSLQQELARIRQELNETVATKDSELESLKIQAAQLEEQVKELSYEKDSLQTILQEHEKHIQEQEENFPIQSTSISAQKPQVFAAEMERDEKAKLLKNAYEEIDGLKAEHEVAVKLFKTLSAEKIDLEEQLAQSQASFEKTKSRIDTIEMEHKDKITHLESQIQRFENEISDLMAANKGLERKLKKAEEDLKNKLELDKQWGHPIIQALEEMHPRKIITAETARDLAVEAIRGYIPEDSQTLQKMRDENLELRQKVAKFEALFSIPGVSEFLQKALDPDEETLKSQQE